MVSSLKEINGLVCNPVHQAVFLSDAARPTPRQYISQRFGLSWPFKGVAHDRLYEIQHPDCSAPFGFDPKTQILPELGLKDRNPLTLSLHRGSLASIPMWFRALFFLVPLGVAPPEGVERFVVSGADAQFPGGQRVRWPEAKPRPGLPVVGQLPYPAGRPPRRERWRDFHADSYMLFPWASRTPIRIVQHSCTGTEPLNPDSPPHPILAARLCCPKPTYRSQYRPDPQGPRMWLRSERPPSRDQSYIQLCSK